MPKTPIDYSKTIMYKIVCNDLNITECYVGHTTNFIKRKIGHKTDCCNEKSKKYNLREYIFIRENGGWENWSMIMIEEYKCENKREAEKRERELYESLGAKLNSQVPMRTQEEINNPYSTYKEYYINNKEKIAERSKEYYINNKEKKLEYSKEYRINNKEKIAEYRKEYYINNNDYFKEKKSIKDYCDICGLDMLKRSIPRHKERRHQKV